MTSKEYKQTIKNTMIINCPEYMHVNFLKFLQNKGLVFNDRRCSKKENILDLSSYSSSEKKINIIFEQLENIERLYEEFEYEKAYRISSICKYKNIQFDSIDDLKANNIIKTFSQDSFDSLNFENPTIKEIEHKIFLKFSMKLDDQSEEKNSIKHTILVIIDKVTKSIEIRQNTIPIIYKNIDNFYEKCLNTTKQWIKHYLLAHITELDFQALTRYMKSKKEEIKIIAVNLRRHGMEANLDSASNVDLTLPILDELRNKIAQEKVFHDSSVGINIKKILEDFMIDIEENSDLPSAKIFWTEKDIRVHIFNAETLNSNSMIKFIGKLKSGESMSYVANYIINSYEELAKTYKD